MRPKELKRSGASTATPAAAGKTWSRPVRRVVSVLILGHLIAIFLGVWGAVPPFSYTTRVASDFFQPYLQATYLNHGYRFFAPNPEASHLIRFEVRRADGQLLGEGHWPDPLQHWPRLHYHRHLMIAETLFVLTNAPPPESVPPPERARWENQRELARKLVAGIQRSLQARYGAGEVKLWLVEHQLPSPPDVAAGRPLNDPSLYLERPIEQVLGAPS